MKKTKSEIVTFKADPSLAESLNGIANKSAFIRAAVTSALGVSCPLCQGSGVLTPNQKEHWDDFAAHHKVEECDDCHELRLTCSFDRKQARGSNR